MYKYSGLMDKVSDAEVASSNPVKWNLKKQGKNH